MTKVAAKIAVVVICMLAVSVFAPQAKADNSPSGTLVFTCAPCTGSVSFGAGGVAPYVGSGINTVLTFATLPNGGDEVGGTFALAFNTGTGAISLTDADGDFNLSGTITSVTAVPVSVLGEVSLIMTANMTGIGPSGSTVTFVINSNPTGFAPGTVEEAHVSVVTPEPASLLLLGTGLVGLGGILRRRIGL